MEIYECAELFSVVPAVVQFIIMTSELHSIKLALTINIPKRYAGLSGHWMENIWQAVAMIIY